MPLCQVDSSKILTLITEKYNQLKDEYDIRLATWVDLGEETKWPITSSDLNKAELAQYIAYNQFKPLKEIYNVAQCSDTMFLSEVDIQSLLSCGFSSSHIFDVRK